MADRVLSIAWTMRVLYAILTVRGACPYSDHGRRTSRLAAMENHSDGDGYDRDW